MRAVLVAILGATIVCLAAACGGGTAKAKYPVNVYVANKHVASVSTGHSSSFLPKVITVTLGHMQVTVHVDNTVANTKVDAYLARGAGRVDLPYTPVSSLVAVRSQHVLFKHDSEVTALSMLLSVDAIDAPQVKIAPELPTNGPATPQDVPGSKLFRWGDPELGFVGRYNAPGPRGGFGVYEPPIKRLAAKYGAHLVDLQGKSVDDVRNAVLNGHPVMAWVGGKTARPFSWLTPSGKKITVDLGEHAVTLVGAESGSFLLNDPLTGGRFKWSTAKFSARWALIGHRALELP